VFKFESEPEVGGHFAVYEQQEALVSDLGKFLAGLDLQLVSYRDTLGIDGRLALLALDGLIEYCPLLRVPATSPSMC